MSKKIVRDYAIATAACASMTIYAMYVTAIGIKVTYNSAKDAIEMYKETKGN